MTELINSNIRLPQLNFASVETAFKHIETDRELGGELVTSPFDLYSVEILRNRHGLRQGETFPTDLFVWGKGEPPCPRATKVGGRPWWPIGVNWPESPDGKPQRFLAQINFSESIDIVGDLPELILVITANRDSDDLSADDLNFSWIPADCEPIEDSRVKSVLEESGPFFGVRHRTEDYPDAFNLTEQLSVKRSFLLPLVAGTKIGGVPFMNDEESAPEMDFLCQLSSIQAAPNVPFAWANSQRELPLRPRAKGIHAPENSAVFGDMGSFFLFIDDDDRIVAHFDSF